MTATRCASADFTAGFTSCATLGSAMTMPTIMKPKNSKTNRR